MQEKYAKSAAQRDVVTTDLRAEVDRIEKQVLDGKKNLIEARNTLEVIVAELVKTEAGRVKLLNSWKKKRSRWPTGKMTHWLPKPMLTSSRLI